MSEEHDKWVNEFNKAWDIVNNWEKETGPNWHRKIDVEKTDTGWRFIMTTVRDVVDCKELKDAVKQVFNTPGE